MTKGFFAKQEIQSLSRPDGKTYSCHSCGLYKTCNSPKMEPFGNFKKGILNIGEAGGETEDLLGKPWQGKAGKLLQKTYRKLGIDLFEDCLNINSVNCRPKSKTGENRTPTNYEIDCCRRFVIEAIEKYKPKVIILLGNSAIYSVIGHRWKKDLGGINKWRGWTIPDQDFKSWICPVFHPSFVMRTETEELYTVWEQDLLQAFEMLEKSLPVFTEPEIHFIEDTKVLKEIKNGSVVSFDYETTGLKPHTEGHQIVCISVATDENNAYVFMLNESNENHFRDLLVNRYIGKMGHNIKFETAWTYNILNARIRNWKWDSMLAAHVLDNRIGITGLKFQTCVNFGVFDYSSEVDKWLKAEDEKNANSMNRVLEFVSTESGRQELMTYCAKDSIYQYRLAKLQMEKFSL